MSGRPRILLNMACKNLNGRDNFTLIDGYAQRVWEAGGLPLLCPVIEDEALMDEMLGLAQGVILIGGKDYDPKYYGQEPHPATDLTRLRPHFDLAFGEKVFKQTNLPILGICGGCQLLAILDGGVLIQDLDNAVEHKGGICHGATITADGWLAQALKLEVGADFTVNSYHHQAIDETVPLPNFKVTARAFDEGIEAIEGKNSDRLILGVQFHPERMEDNIAKAIFAQFVEHAER